ncbi:MAG: PD-(D/E)XK nuclease family protein [Nitrospirae bacterium]|nr:PD-(D/E)XK nuclease family protein [Nitrospirota bacterium]
MESAKVLSANENLIDEVRSELIPDGNDYSSNIVVFPGKRPGHFLKKAIAEKKRAAFIPPLIFSMDAFVDYVYTEVLNQHQRKIDTLDALAILYKLHRHSINPIGGDSYLGADNFFSVGIDIYKDIEEFYIEKVSTETIKQIDHIAEEALPPRSKKMLNSLSFFYKEFYEKLNTLNLSTRSTRYRRVSEDLDNEALQKFEKIVFAGFFVLTKSEIVIFNKLSQSGNSRFLFQNGPGIDKLIKALYGDDISMSERGLSYPEIKFISSSDTHGQVFSVNSILSETTDIKNTVIVLPQPDTLFPLLYHGISSFEETAYNVSLGYPLVRTPLYGFFQSLMETVLSIEGGRVYVPDYIKFTLHPYIKNVFYKGNAELTRIIFHTIEEELSANRARTFLTLSEIENLSGIFEKILVKLKSENSFESIDEAALREHLHDIHNALIGSFMSFKNIGDFANRCVTILNYIYDNTTAKRHPFFYPFAEAFADALHTITQSLLKDVEFTELSGYFNLFRKYLATCHCPFEGTPLRDLQVLGLLETRNIKFDRVIFLDANEEVVPMAKKEDTLLPHKLRIMLNLPTYEDRERLSLYYFDSLLKGAKEAHIFFVENDKKEKSRFVEKILWEKQKATTSLHGHIKQIQYKIALRNQPVKPAVKTPEMLEILRNTTKLSATAIDTYIRCELMFYYRYVLSLYPRETVSGSLESSDVGLFVHEVLGKFFTGMKGTILTETMLSTHQMIKLIDATFIKFYGRDASGSAHLLKAQVKKHLNDLLAGYFTVLTRNNEVSVIDTEKGLSATSVGYNLYGRLDLIMSINGKTVIVDFKTSANQAAYTIRKDRLMIEDRTTWPQHIGSIQLPFYLFLYSKNSTEHIENLNAMCLMLGRNYLNEKIEAPLFTADDNIAEVYKKLIYIITTIIKEIDNVNINFTPTSDRKKICPNCDYINLCGMRQ